MLACTLVRLPPSPPLTWDAASRKRAPFSGSSPPSTTAACRHRLHLCQERRISRRPHSTFCTLASCFNFALLPSVDNQPAQSLSPHALCARGGCDGACPIPWEYKYPELQSVLCSTALASLWPTECVRSVHIPFLHLKCGLLAVDLFSVCSWWETPISSPSGTAAEKADTTLIAINKRQQSGGELTSCRCATEACDHVT